MARGTLDYKKLIAPGVRAEFHNAYSRRSQESILEQIASVHPTTEEVSDFGWIGNVPRSREFLGPRRRHTIRAYEYTVKDKVWENTLEVPRTLVDNEQFPAIRARVRDMAREAVNAKVREATFVYAQGNTRTTYDGLALLLATGDSKRQNQVNLTSSALSASSLQTAIQTMMSFTDEHSEPFGVMPTHLMVGPKLQWTARELLESQTIVIAGTTDTVRGSRNVLEGQLRLIINPYLVGAYDDYWFVIDRSREVGPVLVKTRSDIPTELTIKDDEEVSDLVFEEDVFVFGSRDVFNAVPGAWFLVYGGIL